MSGLFRAGAPGSIRKNRARESLGVGGTWVTDDAPNPRFRLYTRGNA